MRKYKIAIMLLSLVCVMFFLAPIQAATGYGPGAEPNVPPFVPTPPVPPVPPTPPTVTITTCSCQHVIPEAIVAFQQAIALGLQTTDFHIVDMSPIHSQCIRDVFALSEQMSITLGRVVVSTMNGNYVLTRSFVDAQTAYYLNDGEIYFTVLIEGQHVNNITNLVGQLFTNNFVAFRHHHRGAFGRDTNNGLVSIRHAVMLDDLSGLDTNNLMFYTMQYSLETGLNVFSFIDTSFAIDGNGFLHFDLPVGGIVIVTDRPLVWRG